MKKIYIIVSVCLLCFSACELDRYPETNFTDAAFWKTETDVRSACNRMYEQLRDSAHDTRSDELVRTSADNISAGSRSVPSESNNNWSYPYERIFTANNILDKAVNAAMDEATMNRWLAEAYFFRAYQYFLMEKMYGDVPLILKSFDSPNDPVIFSGRTPREDVIQQCYKDLEFATQWLPTRSGLPEKDWGRVTRSSALGMIVRIGLYEGTYGKYHNLNNNYQAHLNKSISAAEALMQEGHDLYPDFQKLFTFDGEGPKNLENILVKVYGPNGAGTTTHNKSRQMENNVSLTRQMVDMFLYADGLPIDKSPMKMSPETSFDDALTNRDPRLNMTVYKLDEEAYKNAYVPFINQHGYGYSLKKGFMLDEWITVNRETVDKMLIRYAEILLSYAEATYELNNSISDGLLDETINKIRKRAGFNIELTNNFVKNNNLDMLEEIRRERTVELMDEGFRYDDIIRWKTAEKVLPTNMIGAKFVDSETTKLRKDLEKFLTDANGMLNGKFVYDEKDMYVIEVAEDRRFRPERDYLYPIPLNEIVLSKGSVVQNPNW